MLWWTDLILRLWTQRRECLYRPEINVMVTIVGNLGHLSARNCNFLEKLLMNVFLHVHKVLFFQLKFSANFFFAKMLTKSKQWTADHRFLSPTTVLYIFLNAKVTDGKWWVIAYHQCDHMFWNRTNNLQKLSQLNPTSVRSIFTYNSSERVFIFIKKV
jgi:hypothetical protein